MVERVDDEGDSEKSGAPAGTATRTVGVLGMFTVKRIECATPPPVAVTCRV